MMSYDDELERMTYHMHAVARERDFWKQQAQVALDELVLAREALARYTK